MRLKWYFPNEPSSGFNKTPSFTPKSSWKPRKGHPCLEAFLNEIEKEIFATPDSRLGYSNHSREEWQAMQSLVDDKSIVIKKVVKDSSVWCGTLMAILQKLKNNLGIRMFIRMLNLPRFSKTLLKPETKCFKV